MGEHECEEGQPDVTGTPATSSADHTRRKLTTAGLAGTGVLMALSTRSAMAMGGVCGSETASAAMSRHGEPPPCGCSPGFYWKSLKGQNVWTEYLESDFPKSAMFNDVFCAGLSEDRKFFKAGKDRQLGDLGPASGVKDSDTNYGCGNANAIAMHAVAAVLNAQFYGERYPPFSNPVDVINAFREALMADLFSKNCSNLNGFLANVDIYGGGIWCFPD